MVKQHSQEEWPVMISDFGRIHSTDVIEREAASALGLRFRQLSAGSFDSELRFARTDHVVAYHERSNRTFQMQGTARADLFTFVAVLPGHPAGHWCGQPLGHDRMGTVSPGAEMTAVPRLGSHHWAIMAYPQVVLRLADEFEVRALGRSGSGVLECNPRSLHGFGSQLISLIDQLGLRPTHHDRAASRRIQRGILRALFTAIRSGERSPLSPPGNGSLRRRGLRRALDLIHESSDRVSIEELAAETGVSQRTLEYAFRDALDVTPVRYVLVHRLNGARRELGAADPAETSVTAIASRWGFTELGRFAVEYKKLFGESPSETLRGPGRTRTFDTRRLATLV